MPQLLDTYRRSSRAAFAALALVTAVACSDDDDPTEVEQEPQIASIVITSGTSSATISNTAGTQTGTLTLRQNQPNVVTFRFVTAAGADDAVLAANRSDFELQAGVPLPTSVSFSASGGTGASYTATITPTTTGTVIIPFRLYSIEHGHAELTRSVSATVAP